MLRSALWYLRSKQFSVIPIKTDGSKKPIVEWTEWQQSLPSEEQIKDWWKRWPDANIGIITGKISNITVFDFDWYKLSEEEKLQYEKTFQKVFTPTAYSPRGGEHRYFLYDPTMPTRNGILKALDIKNDGGYVVAPPSLNGDSKYTWDKRSRISDATLHAVPDDYKSSFSSSLVLSSSFISYIPPVDISNASINFEIGSRDSTLFHIANCLVKGGMPEEEIAQVLSFLGEKCNPPFPEKELSEKIKSALKRQDSAERNLTAEVREWVLSTDVHFKSTDVHKELGLSTRVHKKNVSTILKRLQTDEGLIEKDSKGIWRKIDRSYVEQVWWNDSGKPLPIKFPLEIGEFVKLYPGNIVLLEGQKSQGKSAFALEFCRLNKGLFGSKILYQNVEMADSELLDRFKSYGDVMPIEEWKQTVTFIKQTGEWWDKIQPDGLNVIDYLIEYKEPWQLAQYVFNIHQKLKSGIALVVVQRDPFKPYPTGGRGVRDIPRAIISLIKHKVRLEDVKSYYQTPYGNPTGLCRKYKQVNWWNLRADSDWDHEEEEKYQYFKGERK